MPETIKCPKCGTEIEVAEALSAGIAAHLRSEILAEAALKETALTERQGRLEEAEARLQATVAQRVEGEKARLRAEALAAAREEAGAELVSLAQELSTSKEELAAARKAQAALNKRERELADREAGLELVLEERLAAQLEETRRAAKEQAFREAAQQAARERAELEEARQLLAEKDAKLEAARAAERTLLKQKRELDQRAAELDLAVERRLAEEAAKIRQEAQASVLESQRLKEREKDEQIEGLRRKIDELKQRAEQGSQQLQGEAQELVLEDLLRAAFPFDAIEPVAKGVHGGDVVHRVRDAAGSECGTILWESKRTKAWSDGWLPKLRDDQGAAKAALAVIVTQALPAGCSTFTRVDEVWVSGWSCALPLAAALRSELVQVAAARRALEGQQGKMEALYGYLAGPVFKNRVSAMVETFKSLKEDLDAEKRAMLKIWARRERQLERASAASSGFYGDLQGIIGASLPELPSLSLALPAGGSDDVSDEELPGTGSGPLERVLRFLATSAGPHSKAEILSATGVPEPSWPQLAQQLGAHPSVAVTGAGRGTRYAWDDEQG